MGASGGVWRLPYWRHADPAPTLLALDLRGKVVGNASAPTAQRTDGFSGDGLVLAAMVIFGSYPLFLRFFPEIPALVFLFALQAVGAVTLAVIGGSRKPTSWWLLAALAVVAVANDLFYFLAFRFTTVANAAISHQSVSVFLVFLAPLLLKEAIHRREWVALVVSLIGITVLYSRGTAIGGADDFLGITFGVLSGLFYALTIIAYKVVLGRGLSIRTVNFWRYTISTGLLLPFVALLGMSELGPADVFPLLAFGVLFAGIATGIHVLGISRSRPLHASILGKTEPVFAIVLAFFFLGEPPTVEAVVGGALIIGSSLWLTLGVESSKTSTSNADATARTP